MSYQMNFQMLSSFEGFSTSWAFIGCALRVRFHVIPKTTILCKCFITERANIRALPTMNLKVSSQISFQFEGFATNLAMMFMFVCMSYQMFIKVTFSFKTFSTGWTSIGSILRVRFHVSPKIAILCECFITERANIRALPTMNLKVSS